MLIRDNRTSSANGASGRHERQDSAGTRLVTAASRCPSSVRKSIALTVRHAGQRTQRNQYRAAIATPIVGENSIGICFSWRSFQALIRRSASSSICASEARRLAASLSAARRCSSSILRRLKPMLLMVATAPPYCQPRPSIGRQATQQRGGAPERCQFRLAVGALAQRKQPSSSAMLFGRKFRRDALRLFLD